MPLRAPQVYPGDQRSFDQWTRQVSVTPDNSSVTTQTVADGAITNVKLRPSAPASVIGNDTASPGQPADIVASADGNFLVRRSGTLGFGTIGDSDIPATLARDSEVTAAGVVITNAYIAADAVVAANAASALATFEALADPFPQYENQTRGDARYQKLPLRGSTTFDPPSLVDGQGTTTTVTVTGAALGNFAMVSFSLDLQGITVTSYVSATNTVAAHFQNESGGTLDLASGTLAALVFP